MSKRGSRARLQGIVPPVVTPLASYDELDVRGMERIVEHLLEGGVHGLFLLGSTGEGPALSYRLRREVVDRVCRQVGTRVPVLVGITDCVYAEAINMAEYSARAGATAVVSAPPFYFHYGQADLLNAIETLAHDSPLPLYLYNMPGLVKTTFEADTVARAAQMENVWGFKDSSGDLQYLAKVIEEIGDSQPEFSIFVGPEQLLSDALLLGTHGGVPGGANLFPQLPVRLYEAFLDGRLEEMRAIQQEMDRVGAPIWNDYGSAPGHLRRLKTALAMAGLCSPIPSWPYQVSSQEEAKYIEAHLETCGPFAKPSATRQ